MNKKMKKRLSWLLSFSLLSASVGIWSEGGMQAEAEGAVPVVKILQNGDASGFPVTYPTPATSYGPDDILYLLGADSVGKTFMTQGDLSGESFGMVEEKAVEKWLAVVKTSGKFEVVDWGSNAALTVQAGEKLANAIKVKGFKEKTYDVVSAILAPKNGGDIIAYGSVAKINQSSAEMEMEVGVKVPQEVPEGDYILYLFAETAMGRSATNYQSKEIKVTGETAEETEAPAASPDFVEPTASPEPTEAPVVTSYPEDTIEPLPPETTAPIETPVQTAEATQAPTPAVATAVPEPTKQPEPTGAAAPTKRPEPTQAAVPTKAPSQITVPTEQPADNPGPAATAAVTERPVHTLTPVPSKAPETMTSAAPRPVYTLQPIPSRNPGETVPPVVKPSQTAEPAQVPEPGSTVEQENVTYKVTESGGVALDAIELPQGQKELAIPDTVVVDGKECKVEAVSAGAFAGNKKLEQVTLGKNIKKIEKKAFSGCKNLKEVTLSNKVTTVGAESFSGCTSLKKVSLPDNVKKIGNKAFQGCKSLKNVSIGKAAKVKGGAASAVPFIRTSKNGVVTVETVPVYAAGSSPALTIGNYAFAACNSLKKVIINSAVRVIGSSAFRGCKKLSDITVNSQILEKVRQMALKGINNCTITVPSNKFKPYRTLFRNKGQGKKVLIAKA